MKYRLIQREDFKEKFLSKVQDLEMCSSEELVSRYNEEVLKGIVGVYEQGVYLVALRLLLVRIYNQSPIVIEDNSIISLTDEVKYFEGKLYYLNGLLVNK